MYLDLRSLYTALCNISQYNCILILQGFYYESLIFHTFVATVVSIFKNADHEYDKNASLSPLILTGSLWWNASNTCFFNGKNAY